MAEEQITAVPGAPPMYQAWLAVADAAGQRRRAAPRLRRDAHGLLRRRADARGDLVGRCATAPPSPCGRATGSPRPPRCVASTLATGRAKPDCIGGPLPGVELELRDTADAPDRAGATTSSTDDDAPEGPGEIWVRGPNLFSGYWPDGADGPGRRRAGWAPATSPTATPTATCTWSTGAATWSWSAASTSTRPRSSGCSTPTRRSPRAPSSACPTREPARPCGRSSSGTPGADGHREELREHAGRVAGPVQGADVGALPAVAAALADRQGQPGAAAGARARPGRGDRGGGGGRWLTARLTLLTRAGCHLCADRRGDARPGSPPRPGCVPERSTSTPTPSCRPSTATGCPWSCSTAGSTATSPSTSSGCGGTWTGLTRLAVVLHHSLTRPGRSARCRARQRLCSCVHKRLPWPTRALRPRRPRPCHPRPDRSGATAVECP